MISDCVRYNIQGLSGLKKDAECLAYFAKFSDLATARPISNVDCDHQAGICSAVSESYFRLGRLQDAVIYQELALAKVLVRSRDRESREVVEMALQLRDKQAHTKDWAAMRTTEVRYNLKALPKQEGEK